MTRGITTWARIAAGAKAGPMMVETGPSGCRCSPPGVGVDHRARFGRLSDEFVQAQARAAASDRISADRYCRRRTRSMAKRGREERPAHPPRSGKSTHLRRASASCSEGLYLKVLERRAALCCPTTAAASPNSSRKDGWSRSRTATRSSPSTARAARADHPGLHTVIKPGGLPLELLADERPISKSIRQKSHIRLSAIEASKALAAFGLDGD
jgi:hypothetical protein